MPQTGPISRMILLKLRLDYEKMFRF